MVVGRASASTTHLRTMVVVVIRRERTARTENADRKTYPREWSDDEEYDDGDSDGNDDMHGVDDGDGGDDDDTADGGDEAEYDKS